MWAMLKSSGIILLMRNWLTMVVIAVVRTSTHSLHNQVGDGSSQHDFVGDCLISFVNRCQIMLLGLMWTTYDHTLEDIILGTSSAFPISYNDTLDPSYCGLNEDITITRVAHAISWSLHG